MDALQILKEKGFNHDSELPFCTDKGIEYYIGFNGHIAAVAAFIYDEAYYFITKEELREMSNSARIKGIETVRLYTNYGLELHSKHDKPSIVGFDKIEKVFETEKQRQYNRMINHKPYRDWN